MKNKSRVLYQDGNYVVCITGAGLSVESKRSGKGKLLRPTSMGYTDWVESFKTTFDKSDIHSLIKAFLN